MRASGRVNPVMPQSRSPDTAMLGRLHEALERWEAGGGGPTSSLTGGGAVAELERRLAELCSTRYAVAVASGTIALRAAAAAVNVDSTSSVVIPALDWPAAAAAVTSLGALLLPADCGASSILVDPAAVRRAVRLDTRAVVVTHLAGMPVDVDAIRAAAGRHEIAVIEDGSQALGASRSGRPVGSLGDVAAFSLGPGKLVDAGEGGVVVTNNENIYAAVIQATQHPARHLRVGLAAQPERTLAARIHPAAAMLALLALDEVDEKLEARRRVAMAVAQRTSGTSVRITREMPGERFSWSSIIGIGERAAFAEVRHLDVRDAPLGAMEIGPMLGAEQRKPNARQLMPRVRRLFDVSRLQK